MSAFWLSELTPLTKAVSLRRRFLGIFVNLNQNLFILIVKFLVLQQKLWVQPSKPDNNFYDVVVWVIHYSTFDGCGHTL